MPIYEFYCPDNHKIYSFFARSSRYADQVPRCPDNSKYTMQRRISSFAITHNREESEEQDEMPFDMDESKMEAAMAELERDMGGVDEENPDPKQLSKLMKRFTQMTGGKMPDALEDMMVRMDKGEDPEALEEEYGDVLDDENMFQEMRRTLRRQKAQPSRDPELYEITDYL